MDNINMHNDIRKYALEAIVDVLEKGSFSKAALSRCFDKNNNISDRDKRFISMLVRGTIERAVELDYIIGKYCNKPVDKLKPYIRNILRMSVYQIKYMEQVPDSAIVNEAVKLTAKKGYNGLKGYVNGVLRNIARTINDIQYPDRDKEPLKYMSVVYSMPEWLVSHYIKELGISDAEKAFKYFLDSSDVTVRCTGIKYSKEMLCEMYRKAGIEVNDGVIFDYALRLSNPGSITGLPGYDEGSFIVQDESSMIPAHIAKLLFDDDRIYQVLDICAAPGGKSLQLAGCKDRNIHIDARDISEGKVALIEENAKRLNIDNITVKVSDALVYDDSCAEKYDAVIADLPCSGLGVLSGKSDIKYNISEKNMAELSVMQKTMLNIASDYVKKNGFIVFSTCTLNKSENESNVNIFLNEHADFQSVNLCNYIPDTIKGLVTGDGYIKVVPGRVRADGFFVAVLRRVS